MFYWLFHVSVFQIIHKIKKPNDPSVTETVEGICDRIFELVDKNNDSELV